MGTAPPGDLADELGKIGQYLSPAVGEDFLAIGVKFSSFEMIESFALLTASFGRPFQLDLLGFSTLIIPTPEEGDLTTPLAEAQLALEASFIPDEGFLGVQAQLTPASYVLSKACRLTGGFAFFAWFDGEHAGDFVVTLGGYHPKFAVPSHYPRAPRLGFNWQVDRCIFIKGEAYFALCAHALMAGGYLEANYHSGSVQASFKAGADFLIAWKPYRYGADIYVDLGAKVGWISVDAGADLHIWGPEFGGRAEIHLSIVSFKVSFGSASSRQAKPIDWRAFKRSFLPADDKICSVNVTGGLIRKSEWNGKTYAVINPKELSLSTHAVIPSNHAYRGQGTGSPINTGATNIGIGSMAVGSDDLHSAHTIRITRQDANGNDLPVEGDFKFTPIHKNAPSGLWGESLSPDLNGARFIENTLAGFQLTPAKPPKQPDETLTIDKCHLQDATTPAPRTYAWKTIPRYRPSSAGDSVRRSEVAGSVDANSSRDNLLQALGFDPTADVNVDPSIADAFTIAPQVMEVR